MTLRISPLHRLAALFTARKRPNGAARRTPLALERLEDRWVPATFDLAGTALTVNGTTGDDRFQLSQTTNWDYVAKSPLVIYALQMNGESASYTNRQIDHIIVNGNGGNDTGILVVQDNYSVYLGNKAYVTGQILETAVLGTGGGVLQLNNSNFLQFNDFNNTYAYMGIGTDTGKLFDSPGNDIFVSAGHYSYVTAPNSFHLIEGGSSVYSYTINGGNDQAWFYAPPPPRFESSLNSFVVSGNAYSYMSGNDDGTGSGVNGYYFNEAVGFQVTYGVAAHGNAIAYMIDSPANDVFVGSTNYSYMYSDNSNGTLAMFNEVEGFQTVYAQSFVGGTDFAYNYDPQHNILGGNWILLT